MKIKQMPIQKQTIPLERFYWNDPKKTSHPSFINSYHKRKGIMSSASRIEEVERQFDNLFILTKKKEGCYYSNVTIDFAPKKTQEKLQQRENDQEKLILPIFNQDKRYYTPGFILAEDRSYFQETSVQYELDNFEEKKKMYENEANNKSNFDFYLRQPRSRYCYVCKKQYENHYLEHLKEENHWNRLESCMGQKYIQATLNEHPELAIRREKKEKNRKQKQPRKVKQIQKQIQGKKEKMKTRSKKNLSGEDQTNYTSRTRRK